MFLKRWAQNCRDRRRRVGTLRAMRSIVWLLIAVAACGKGDDKKPEPAVGSTAGSASGSGSATAGSAAAGSAASATPPPLSPKIKAARCGDPCLFLVDTPLDKLIDTY